MSHGVTADCKSAAFTHSWFDSSTADHFEPTSLGCCIMTFWPQRQASSARSLACSFLGRIVLAVKQPIENRQSSVRARFLPPVYGVRRPMVRTPPCEGGDAGSTPAGHPDQTRRSNNFNQDIAQPGRARARGARGRGIEARYPDHLEKPRFPHSFRADRRRLSQTRLTSEKSQPMRVSVAIRATGSSAISRRQILARSHQASPGPITH